MASAGPLPAWCTIPIAAFSMPPAEYAGLLAQHGMMASMSRPANPYDNASCESFMKTLKREEIYANEYADLKTSARHIEEFIEQYYNGCRLHSALGYRPPEEFEREANAAVNSAGATMSFFRHEEGANGGML